VERQVQTACLGVAQAVKDLQTETGVKDAFTQSVIDELITSAQNMQKLQPNKSATEIQSELMAWVNTNQARVYNPFLMMKGMKAAWEVSFSESLTLVSFAIKVSMRRRTPQSKSCILYCLGFKNMPGMDHT